MALSSSAMQRQPPSHGSTRNGRRGAWPSPKFPIVIGWAGMRGVVTLAAALALPLTLAGDQPYPGRCSSGWPSR